MSDRRRMETKHLLVFVGSVLSFALAVGSFLRARVLRTRLLRRQYYQHRAAWKQDGEPTAQEFQPPALDPQESRATGMAVGFYWAFETPAQARTDADTVRLVGQFRRWIFAGWLGIAMFLGSFWFS